MNVKQLREKLKKAPDDFEVAVTMALGSKHAISDPGDRFAVKVLKADKKILIECGDFE